MVKKILLGGALAALIGLLVVGAINRTAARGSETEGAQPHGQSAATDSAARGNGQRAAQSEAVNWQVISGTITYADASRVEVILNDGRLLEVGGRAWQLAVSQSFTAAAGDQVTVRGFDENGEFQAMQLDNLSNGQQIVLRDTFGRPLWAGRGRS